MDSLSINMFLLAIYFFLLFNSVILIITLSSIRIKSSEELNPASVFLFANRFLFGRYGSLVLVARMRDFDDYWIYP